MEQAANLSQTFSVKAVLREGWSLVRGSKLSTLATILPMLTVAFIAFVVLNNTHLNNPNYYTGILYNLLSPLIEAILLSGFLAGLAMIGLKRARHEAIRWSEGLCYFGKLPKLASIAYLEALSMLLLNSIVLFSTVVVFAKLSLSNNRLVILITLLVLMILAVMLKSLFSFSFQFALDKGTSAISAIGRSVKTVRRHYWKVLLVIMVLTFFNLLGACLAGVGLFWSIPFSYITIGIMYRELADRGV